MRTIARNPNPPPCLSQEPAGQEWEAFIGTPCHAEVGESLQSEQQYLCCYCESGIMGTDSHIEHMVPRNGQNGNPGLTYQYTNLAVSCNGGTEENRHCGHHKGGQYNPALFSPPHDPAASRLFRYLINGVIEPVHGLTPQDHAKAEYLIRLLNLRCPRLAGSRRTHARSLLGTLGDPAMRQWALDYYLQPDQNGNLRSFHSLSRTILGR